MLENPKMMAHHSAKLRSTISVTHITTLVLVMSGLQTSLLAVTGKIFGVIVALTDVKVSCHYSFTPGTNKSWERLIYKHE